MKLLTLSTAFLFLTSGSVFANLDLRASWDNAKGQPKARAMTLAGCSALTSELLSEEPAGNAAQTIELTSIKTAEMAKGLLNKVVTNQSEVANIVDKEVNAQRLTFSSILRDEALDADEQALLEKNILFCMSFNALSSIKL